jgi:hypothetical protein
MEAIGVVALGLEGYESNEKIKVWVRRRVFFIIVGKCKEFLEEIRRLIAKEVDRMPNAKMSMISLSASKTFLVRHLFNDCNDGKVELLKGE